jgi:hypothetical protein
LNHKSTVDRYSFFGVEFDIGFSSEDSRVAFQETYKHCRVSMPGQNQAAGLCFSVVSYGAPGDTVVRVEGREAHHLIEVFKRGSNRYRFSIEGGTGSTATYTIGDLFLGGKQVMEVGPTDVRIIDTERFQAYTESVVFHTVLSAIPQHHLLHAGVVSYRERGVILCGEADRGKTTLTLGLVQAGFKFLSDEVAFLSLQDNTVGAFPRALGIREKTLTMFAGVTSGVHKRPTRSLSGDDKWLVDIEDLFPESLGAACSVSHVFFLEGFADRTRLAPLSGSQSAMKCMRFLHTAENDTFKALLNITEFVGGSRCYDLHQGPPTETVERITELVTANV